MEVSGESESAPQQEKSARTAAQRRAEIRRRKLLLNSEDRMNKIVGFSKSDADSSADRREGDGICTPMRHTLLGDGTKANFELRGSTPLA
ncbi:Calcium signal-modulating cyclophilin ligand [Anabarilius grahami]|uniref:Calcium signal-modulating cyclophilin ligand n=1 Tax=Anabarilius grahami TaxID=495550 RepID=A0A3N0XUC2_ANAGA|nr:Calcium signal-modulating cyclophilin ligand [Anabarilius grahami]